MWGGYRQRLIMSLLYAISFHYFLRIDEALHIQVKNIQICDPELARIKLTLDFRKTMQNGGRFSRAY
jgi:hypothetical protein